MTCSRRAQFGRAKAALTRPFCEEANVAGATTALCRRRPPRGLILTAMVGIRYSRIPIYKIRLPQILRWTFWR
jgi:hypothetical protein